MSDNLFDKKFNSMRGQLLGDLRAAPTGFDPDLVLRAFAAHLQEISPMHNCPRWELIKAARGWTVFLTNFISDKKKLDDAIWRTDPDVADAIAFLEAQRVADAARYAQEKKEKALEKKRQGRYGQSAQRGFICE